MPIFKNRFRKTLIKLSATTLVALSYSQADAQSLNCFEGIIFGEIVPCGSAGTVTITPNDSRTSSCVTVSGPFSKGRCVASQSSFPFSPMQISVTASTFTITNGTTNMSVTDFNIITNAGGCCTTQTAPAVEIPIGGTLNVGGTQASGTYTGTLGVSVVFQ